MTVRKDHLRSAKFRIDGALAYYEKVVGLGDGMSDAQYDQNILLMLSSLTKAVDELGEVLYKGAMIRRDKENG